MIKFIKLVKFVLNFTKNHFFSVAQSTWLIDVTEITNLEAKHNDAINIGVVDVFIP
jgi:hypothetical protein